ncbi:hypothetical protein, partial [Planotetraspora phitsanulokensis]
MGMRADGRYQVPGLTDEQQRLYRHLLFVGFKSMDDLARLFGPHAVDSLAALRSMGLIYGDPPVTRRPSAA